MNQNSLNWYHHDQGWHFLYKLTGVEKKKKKIEEGRSSEVEKLSRRDEGKSSSYFNASPYFSRTLKPSVFNTPQAWHCWVTLMCVRFAKREEAPRCSRPILKGKTWPARRDQSWPLQECLKDRSQGSLSLLPLQYWSSTYWTWTKIHTRNELTKLQLQGKNKGKKGSSRSKNYKGYQIQEQNTDSKILRKQQYSPGKVFLFCYAMK